MKSVCDDGSIGGSEADDGFGNLGPLLFSEGDFDAHAHRASDGSPEFVGLVCLFDGLRKG